MAKGHGKLIQNMVTAFAFVGTTLFMLTEFELEFDELVLLVWAILLPLLGFIGLIAPLIRESAEVRLYLVVIIVLPIALTYFYGSYYWPFDEAMLFALTLAPIVSLIRTIRASLKSQLPSYNRDFYKERLPELFLLLCVRTRSQEAARRTGCGLGLPRHGLPFAIPPGPTARSSAADAATPPPPPTPPSRARARIPLPASLLLASGHGEPSAPLSPLTPPPIPGLTMIALSRRSGGRAACRRHDRARHAGDGRLRSALLCVLCADRLCHPRLPRPASRERGGHREPVAVQAAIGHRRPHRRAHSVQHR